jgi:D-alanine-D-alanine ligase
MRLCTLVASYEQANSPFRDVDPYPVPERWVPEHDWERCMVEKISAVRTVRDLSRRGFDAFVNLCDGCWEEEQAGIDVVIELSRLGQAYTGPDARFFEPTRQALKLVCADVGVDTPRYLFAADRKEALFAAEFRFPLLVKHPNGYGSLGLTPKSRVTNVDELLTQVDRMVAEYGGALIEEFVEGREFTVLVAEPGPGEKGPRGYTPLEVLFPPGETFKTFDIKWREYEVLRTPPVEDADIAERLQRMAGLVFQGFEGVGYARCDVRMDREGRLYMLDLNSNPGIFYAPETPGMADLILTYSPGGHRAFLDHIVAAGIRHRDRRRRKWLLRHHPEKGHVAVAAVDIAEGERVRIGEDVAHRLASRAHAERSFPAWRKQALQQRPYPLSDEIYLVESDDADSRFPALHGCDPNLVIDGLDFVARRAIRKGELLTLDLSTLAGPSLIPFECKCKSPLCRGLVRETDYLEPWVEERYGERVHDWVRMSRRRAKSASNRIE